MNNKLHIEKQHAVECINDILQDAKTSEKVHIEGSYHHTSSYSNAPSILEYGLLSIEDQIKSGIINLSDEKMIILNDIDSHANGCSAISLAVMGLTDLYPNEMEFLPFSPNNVDVLISQKLRKARTVTRVSINYGNEFQVIGSIQPEYFESLDTRLEKLVDSVKQAPGANPQNLIEKYNALKNIAVVLKTLQLSLPLREMSDEKGYVLDVDRLDKSPYVYVKK